MHFSRLNLCLLAAWPWSDHSSHKAFQSFSEVGPEGTLADYSLNSVALPADMDDPTPTLTTMKVATGTMPSHCTTVFNDVAGAMQWTVTQQCYTSTVTQIDCECSHMQLPQPSGT
jgi:hypothetical protein